MIGIALADIYYKIEDKWFDLLDWLEAHGLPVYKIVDPLEKRGIPSLPVFVALSLILLYIIFGLLLAGGGPLVCFVDEKGSVVSAADVSIYNENNEIVFSGTTGDSGCVSVALADGSYEASLDKSGYDSNKHKFDVSGGKSDKVTVRKQQGALSKTVCFSPRDAGDVTVTIRNSAGVYQNDFVCAKPCKLSIQSGMYYTFTTSTHSSDTFSYDDLKNKSSTQCIALSEEQQNTQETGRFTVQVVNAGNSNLKDIRVHLVNPDDNATDVVSSSLTDAQGKITFTGNIGTDFRIYVPAPANTNFRSFLDTEKFSFSSTDGFKKVTLYNGTASIVFTVVDPQPVPGAYVTLFSQPEGTGMSYGTTNSSGQIRFSVDAGKDYRAAFSKTDYDYVEKSVRGGNDYTVTLTRTAEAKLGSIEISVVRSDNRDEPISGVTLTLYNITSDGTPLQMGIPNPKLVTADDGRGYMSGVPIGAYCVIATRGNGGNPNTCDEGKVTVTAGKRSNITIALKPVGYTLTVTVTAPGGAGAGYANVALKEVPGRKTITTKTANDKGIAAFSVVEEQRVYIYVTYTAQNGETFVAEQLAGPFRDDEQVTVQLAHLDTTLRLMGIFKTADLQADSLVMPPMLGSGAIYYFGFQLGLPNITGINRWDKIESDFSMAEPKIAVFNEHLGWDFPVNGDIAITNDNGPSAIKKITISGVYEPAGITVTFAMPFTVKSDFGGDFNNSVIFYNSKWTSTAYNQIKNDPASGTNKYPFNVSKSAIIQPPSQVQGLNFTLALAIANETGSYKPENYSALVGDLFNLTATITHAGDKNYSGVIRVLSLDGTVNFTAGWAPSNTIRIDPNGRYADITVSDSFPFQPGQTMTFTIKGKAIATGRAYMPINITYQNLQVLANPLPNFNPWVYDSMNAHITITKPSSGMINDFTTSMHFSVKDRTSKTIDQQEIVSIVMSGSAIQNGECRYDKGSSTPQTIKPDPSGYKANFTVNFIENAPSSCPLVGGGDIQISVVTQTQDYIVDPLALTVTPCVSDVTTRTKTVKSGDTNDISDLFAVDIDGACTGTPIGIRTAVMGVGCSLCKLDDGTYEIQDGDDVRDLTRLSGGQIYVKPPIDLYHPEVTGSNVYADISLAITLNSSEAGYQITRLVSIPLYITITPATGPGPGPGGDEEPGNAYFANYFKPLSIQKYTNSPTGYDCSSNYCTLEQFLQKIEDCANPSNTCATSYSFKMVDEGWVTSQVVELAKAVYPSFSNKISDVAPTTNPGGYLIIDGTASAGDNTAVIRKVGTGTSAYKILTFAHTTDAPSGVQSVQLYMPIVSSDLTSSGKQLFSTSYSTKGIFDPTKAEVLDLLNTSIVTQWSLDSYPRTWGTAIYDHHMNASIDNDIDRPSIFLNGNRLEFVGKTENSLKRLLNSFIAYMDPDDGIMVDATHEFLVLDNGVIKTGTPFFSINTSDVSIGDTKYDSLRAKIRERIKNQLAGEGIDVDQTYLSNVPLVDGIMGDSYMVVAIDNRNRNEHIVKFQSKFGNSFQPPENGILWGDSLRHYVYAPNPTVAASLLDVLMGTATTSYEKVGGLVVQYETKAMNQINNTVASKKTSLTNGQNYSTIWKTTPCGLNLTSIQALGVKIFLNGVEVTTENGAFKDGAIYLVNMVNESSQFTVYAKTIKDSTTTCGTTAPPNCGNGVCGTGETCSNCQQDCGVCPAVCGNGIKETGEECDGTALGSCTACTPNCICRRPLDLVFLGDNSGDRLVDLYNYSKINNGDTINDNTKDSRIRTRLDVPDFSEDKIKIADIDGDGKSEIIIFASSGDEKKLYVFEKNDGSINLTAGYNDWKAKMVKTITFKSLDYADFAVFQIGSEPALAMLKKSGSNNDIYVYKYSSILSGAVIDSNYNTNNAITRLDINDGSFNTLKAVKLDGGEVKLIAITRTTGLSGCYVAVYSTSGVGFGEGGKDWNAQHSKYFYFWTSSGGGSACSDIDFLDWDSDGKTDIAVLREGPALSPNENDIRLYTLDSIPENSGGGVKITDDQTYRTQINTDDRQAENLYTTDINGDGKEEILQADLTGDGKDSLIVYTNSINNKIGDDINNVDQIREKEIKMTDMPYIDFAAYDWMHNFGPKIA